MITGKKCGAIWLALGIFNYYIPWGGDRGNLPQRNKLDITKSTLASLAAAYSFRKVIINIAGDVYDGDSFSEKIAESLPRAISIADGRGY